MERVIGRVVDGKVTAMEIIDLDAAKNTAYPSEYFTQNPHKPVVRVVDRGANTMTGTMNAALFGTRDVQPSVVVAFMHQALKKWKTVEITSEWKSHGLTISPVGESAVTDLYTVKPVQPIVGIEVDTMDMTQTNQDNFYLYWACSASRIHASEMSKAEEYKSNILTKMIARGNETIFSGFQAPLMAMGRWNTTINDPNYLTLISMIDMYLNRHPGHECAALRVATIPTRLHGFSAYQDLHHITELLSVKLDVALRFIYADAVGKEVTQLIKSGEEVENRFSYTPYLVKMNCIQSSPYSSNNNQHFSCWVHTIGCMMGNSRSCNAKKLDKVSPLTLFHHAAVVAYYMKDGAQPSTQFTRMHADDKYIKRNDNGEFTDTLDLTTPPALSPNLLKVEQEYVKTHTMRDPLNVIALYYILGGWPAIPTAWAKAALKGLKNPRQGSWGEYWKNLSF